MDRTRTRSRRYVTQVSMLAPEYIVVTHSCGQLYFISAMGDLYSFLTDPRKVSFLAAGKSNPYPRILLKEANKRFYLHRFLYFCYRAIEAGESATEFALRAADTMRSAQDERGDPLEIDHVNNDKFNDTVWNLALLTREQNRLEKNDLAGRLRSSYLFTPFIMPNGEYRAAFGHVRSGEDRWLVPLRFTATARMTEFMQYALSVPPSEVREALLGSGTHAGYQPLRHAEMQAVHCANAIERFCAAANIVDLLRDKLDPFFLTWESPADLKISSLTA